MAITSLLNPNDNGIVYNDRLPSQNIFKLLLSSCVQPFEKK